jgi:membrane associated rhomboid family serine protease
MFMPIPIGDDNSDRHTTLYINYLLIAINIFVFIYWQYFGLNVPFTFAYAAVPGEILTGRDIITDAQVFLDPYTNQQIEMPGLQVTPVPVFLTLITSMFMHGGVLHIAGNMLYLWICGDNLEHSMGHFRYLAFYLLTGVLAGLAHVFSTAIFGQNLLIPSLGASGAISGVLGGYLLLFPRRYIRMWFLLFSLRIPALIVVGLWFVFQVMNGLGALGGEEAGGIAYAAHIGGFIAGFLLVKSFAGKQPATVRRRR